MISRSIFIAEPSGRLEELKEKIKEILEKEEESCCGFCDEEDEDCNCLCKCCEVDEDFEERDDTEKAIIIDRSQIEDDVWEFLFFDDETSEFVWAFYGDYDYNEAKEKFLEEFDHLDVKFYLAD